MRLFQKMFKSTTDLKKRRNQPSEDNNVQEDKTEASGKEQVVVNKNGIINQTVIVSNTVATQTCLKENNQNSKGYSGPFNQSSNFIVKTKLSSLCHENNGTSGKNISTGWFCKISESIFAKEVGRF